MNHLSTPIFLFLFVFIPFMSQADWPQFRANAARSGLTSETLSRNLHLQWTFKPGPGEPPEWMTVNDEKAIDQTPQIVVAKEICYFGSPLDGKIYALDLTTGLVRWAFYTEGPVRYAPALMDGQLFATSDDGFLYCLDAYTGALQWKQRGGPMDAMILFDNRLISRWPARGGACATHKALYFAAGAESSDQAFLYALDKKTGKVLWVNDTLGAMESPCFIDGYLTATSETITAPVTAGKTAVFNRTDGKFLHYLPVPSQSHSLFLAPSIDLSAINDEDFRKEKFIASLRSGDTVAAASATGHVFLIDWLARTVASRINVDGEPYGLAAADGRLLVSTSKGRIYAFGEEEQTTPRAVLQSPPPPHDTPNMEYSLIAADILRKSRKYEGYCVDWGASNGDLTRALALMSKMFVIAIDDSPQNVSAIRNKLEKAGVYGTRAIVILRKLDATALPDGFADLIVSEGALTKGADMIPFKESWRCLKKGGVVRIGRKELMTQSTKR